MIAFDFDFSSFNVNTNLPDEVQSPASSFGMGHSTVSLWVRFDNLSSATNDMTILSDIAGDNSNGVTQNYAMRVSSTRLEASSRGNDTDDEIIVYNHNFVDDTWYHIVWVNEHGMDGESQGGSTSGAANNINQGHRLFVNGAFVASHYNSGAQVLPDNGMRVGGNNDGSSSEAYFDGYMDGLAVWDVEIGPNAIVEIFNSGRNVDLRNNMSHYVSSSDLRLFYNFETASTQTVVDATGNTNHNGTIVGGSILVNGGSVSTNKNTTINIDLSNYASDIEGDNLSYQITSGVSHGQASISGNILTYIPDAGYVGEDKFSFIANDGSVDSDPGVILIYVLDTETSDTVYIHNGSTTGPGTLEDPFNSFNAALTNVKESSSTGYATAILLPGTYTSTSANPIAIYTSDMNLHLKSHSDNPSDTHITTDESSNGNWGITMGNNLKIEGIKFSGIRPAGTGFVNDRIIIDQTADSLIIKNSIFTDNTLRDGTDRPFIRNLNGKILIENSTFNDNSFKTRTAGAGGSVYAIESGAPQNTNERWIVVENSHFENNTVSMSGLFESGPWGANSIDTGSLYVNNSQFINQGYVAEFMEAHHSVFYNPPDSNGNSIRIARGGKFYNCVIRGHKLGRWNASYGTIKNSILADLTTIGDQSSGPGWDISYSLKADVSGSGNGTGTNSIGSLEEVLFVDHANHDFHLQGGSPAIDFGDPNDDYSNEPSPNGSRINAGAYGNTSEAQTSSAPITSDFSYTILEDKQGFSFKTSTELVGSGDVDISEYITDAENNVKYFVDEDNSISTSSNAQIFIITQTGYNQLAYFVNENWHGTDTFDYQVIDETGLKSNISKATITVISVNDAPTTIQIDTDTNGEAIDITLNSNDVDGDDVTYIIVSNPSNGTLSALSGNTITYTPNQGFNGSDTFTYKVNDGQGLDSNISDVDIQVTSSVTSTYGGDVTLTVNPNSVVEIPIEVTDSGALGPSTSSTDHIRLSINLKGSTVNTLDDLELILVTPAGMSGNTELGYHRILLARGINTPKGVNDSGHYYLPASTSQEFLNTVFSEEATTYIVDGSNPFIGDFLPNRKSASFNMSNHEINGTWNLYVHNHNGGDTIEITKAELQLMYDDNSSGTSTYSEKNNWVFGPTDTTGEWIVNPGSTVEGIVPISIPSGTSIQDIDLELTALGSTVNTLKDFQVILMNDSGTQNTVFNGELATTNFAHGVIHKTRFSDDQGHQSVENRSLIANKLDAYTGFGPLKNQSTTQFRIFFVNNNGGDVIRIPKSDFKIYIEL